jgi:uncharacterized protein (UPF0147 family)
MKSIVKMMLIVLFGTMVSCGEKEKPLYDQVMDIHDEVMPKMDVLYQARKQLQDSIAHTAALSEEQKMEMAATILVLDSASNSMMVWMREFNPPDEKNDKEAFDKYMESELVRVKKMREQVMKALEQIQK